VLTSCLSWLSGVAVSVAPRRDGRVHRKGENGVQPAVGQPGSRRARATAWVRVWTPRKALDVACEQPEGVAFLIPVRLEECEIPERLNRWQWVDLFSHSGDKKLLRVLRSHAGEGRAGIAPHIERLREL
jgi:hypothetical protein